MHCATAVPASSGDTDTTASHHDQPASMPCVEQLTSPADRLAALLTLIGSETEPIVTLTHLLRLCRDEHIVLWERAGDPDCQDHVAATLARLREQVAELPHQHTGHPADRARCSSSSSRRVRQLVRPSSAQSRSRHERRSVHRRRNCCRANDLHRDRRVARHRRRAIQLAADVPRRDDGLREPVNAERGNAFCRAGRTEAQLAFTVMPAHAIT